MSNNIAIILSGLLLLVFTTSPSATPGGKEIFIEKCSHCHRAASTLHTEKDKIAELLNSQDIRQHRFTLDEAEMQALINYLQQGSS